MSPPKFKDKVLCFSGKFGDNTTDQIKKWTENNGGTYRRQYGSSVTHLIVSEVNWRKRVPEVEAARKDKSVKILNCEWFDDKLRLPGRVPETKYDWRRIDEESEKLAEKHAKQLEREAKRKAKEAERKKKDSEKINYSEALLEHTNKVLGRNGEDDDEEESGDGAGLSQDEDAFIAGALKAKEDLNSNNLVIYRDCTGFKYDINVSRVSLELMRIEAVELTIYETITVPHYYSCVVKHRNQENKPFHKTAISVVHGTTYAVAFRAFRNNFQIFTRITWEDRFTHCRTLSESSPIVSSDSASEPPASSRPTRVPVYNRAGMLKQKAQQNKAKSKARAQGEETGENKPLTPEQRKQALEDAFAKMKYEYRLPEIHEPRGVQEGHSLSQKLWFKQDDKSVYELFGAEKDDAKKKAKKTIVVIKKPVLSEYDKARIEGLKARGMADAPIVFDDSDSGSESDGSRTVAGSEFDSDTEEGDQSDEDDGTDGDEDAMQGVETSPVALATSSRRPVPMEQLPEQNGGIEVIELGDDDNEEEEEEEEGAYDAEEGDTHNKEEVHVYENNNSAAGAIISDMQDWAMVDAV